MLRSELIDIGSGPFSFPGSSDIDSSRLIQHPFGVRQGFDCRVTDAAVTQETGIHVLFDTANHHFLILSE